jgi:hypothetical protein
LINKRKRQMDKKGKSVCVGGGEVGVVGKERKEKKEERKKRREGKEVE